MIFRLCLVLIATLVLLTEADVRGEEGLDAQVAQATLVTKGQVAPDFSCQFTDGRDFTLSAQRGKVTVLYFFSTSVGACVTEMRHLEEEIFQKLRNRDDFQIVAVGRGHPREDLVRVGGENQITFPLVADPQAGIYNRYFTKFVPRTVVVGRDGLIAWMASGFKEVEGVLALQQVLQKELK